MKNKINKNVWLEIDLEEYENHMSLPSIAQSQYLSDYFEKILNIYKPKTVAFIGCSGGNGLDKAKTKKIEKMICVDINPNYLREAERRYSRYFTNIEFICNDIASSEFMVEEVELVFVGLVFEYVEKNQTIENISKILKACGKLVIVLQVKNLLLSEVSQSPYKNLEKLSKIFSFVAADEIIELSEKFDFELVSKSRTVLKSTKTFDEIILIKKS